MMIRFVKYAKKNKVLFYRGKNNDVLSRFYEIALKYKLQTVIRCNADCPFLEVEILKKC